MNITNDIIVHKLAKFLQLTDIINLTKSNNVMHNLSKQLLQTVTTVDVTPYVYIDKLVEKCPRITEMTISGERDLSQKECDVLSKLTLYKLTYLRKRSCFSMNPTLNLQHIKHIHLHSNRSIMLHKSMKHDFKVKYDTASSVFTLISNDGRSDRMLTSTHLLMDRLISINNPQDRLLIDTHHNYRPQNMIIDE